MWSALDAFTISSPSATMSGRSFCGSRSTQMTGLSLELAVRAIDAALAKAAEISCAPLTVVVLDAGGHDVALKRQDGSGILRADIARGKAWGALGMGLSSRELAERAQKVPA